MKAAPGYKNTAGNTVGIIKQKVLLFVRKFIIRVIRLKRRNHNTYSHKISSPRHGTGFFSFFKTKGRRVYIFAACCLVFVIVCVVLTVIFTGGKPKTVAAADSKPVSVLPAKIVMPVYASLSISKGITADVIKEVQQKLMDLGYMDNDVTDGVYNDQTVQAIKHFQRQENIDTSGTIDQNTYNLLFAANAPSYTISLGAKDSEDDVDVSNLEQRLCELGYISQKGITGSYDEDTQDAVKKFQKLNNLDASGSADQKTMELLYADNAVANYFSYGEQNDDILKYQKQLKKLGYMTSEPDGKFGVDTKSAIKRFQQANGLIADGYLGPQTEQSIMSADAEGNAISLGAKGSDVTKIQKRLKELKYISSITGYFGSATDTAVRSFQHNNGVPADGKVGPTTMNLLMSEKAKKSTGINVTGTNVSSIISIAKSKQGCKYVRGGKGPNVFDCSGFVFWCLNKVGVKQGYMTSAGWAGCSKYKKITSMGDLRRGDVIVYEGHVTLCEGGGYQIEASCDHGQVIQRQYSGSSYWKSVFVCGFRIF